MTTDEFEGASFVMPELPPVGSSDETIEEWVSTVLDALDTTPRRQYWRWHAQGGRGMAQIIAESAPRHYRLDVRVSVTEMRLLTEAAKRRGMGVRPFVRSCLATMMIVAEGHSRDDLPTLAQPGILGPRRD